MHPQIKEILSFVKQQDCFVSLISNGSMPIKWWGGVSKYIDSINITYHGEFAEYEKFIHLIKFLSSQMRVHINVTMHPDDFSERQEIVESLLSESDMDISLTAKPLLIDFGTELYPYTSEQLAFIKNIKKMNDNEYD